MSDPIGFAITLIAAAFAVAWVVAALVMLATWAYRTDWRSFLDRPLCFVLGHPADGSRFIAPTNWVGHPADLYQCRRCGHVVTVVRP